MALYQIEGHTLIASALSSNSIVIDLGANVGRFSRAIIERFHCRAYAIEANPALCGQIASHRGLAVHNFAVAATSGTIGLHLAGNSEASTILPEHPPDMLGTIKVPAVRLDQLLNLLNLPRVDLIKFDIEGAEIQVIDTCSDPFLRSIPQLSIEFHDFAGLTPVCEVKRIVERLKGLGFFCVKIWHHAYGDTLFINRRLLPTTLLQRLWAQYVTPNWWKLRRIMVGSCGTRC